ncbi:CBS domain-containing protein [Rhodocytophaga rosea]|uniref:CBS domain-containing protein n=1 Tax=Rhodocytophaga rosea TaxID=2704465 RepID=A0A6C0GF53_9BACT|nr:CBS domain-containing protein [Rhodocytophaga rosea]QHT66578.1 CBS domain-containing protein [Rhodocytophaga rosea]
MKTAEEVLRENAREIISVIPDTTIYDALQKMVHHKIGAILVKEDNEIVGIWTERDLMHDVLREDFNIRTARIGDYMTTGLLSAPHTDSCYELMDKFLGMRLRHLLIEKNGEYIGMLSSGDVMKETLREKTREYETLNFEVSWDYYENWRTPVTKNTSEVNELYMPYPANLQARRSR